MEALHHVIPEGVPVSLQVVLATLVLGVVYSFITADRPFAGFPVIAVNGQNPRKSWIWHGREALAEGLRKVYADASTVRLPIANAGHSSPVLFKSSQEQAQRSCCLTNSLMSSAITRH